MLENGALKKDFTGAMAARRRSVRIGRRSKKKGTEMV